MKLYAFLIYIAVSIAAQAGEKIQVSRFAMNGNFMSALEYTYLRDHNTQGFYKPGTGFKTVKRESGCPSLLESYQQFPLRKMVEVGYLTQAQAQMYSKMGSDISPMQMTFFTKIDTRIPASFDKSIDGIFARDAVGDGKVLASLYSVSSYKLNVTTGEVNHVPIPLMLEPKWAPVLKDHLAPQKRMFLWEWGRAAQDGPGEIDDLLRAATFGVLKDVFMLGWAMKANVGEVASYANILLHAKDKAHVIAYMRRHPTAQIIRHPLDENDVAFIVPIREMITKYQPEKLSSVVSEVIKATGNQITAEHAIMALEFLKRHRWEELNIGYPGVKDNQYPIVFAPVSSGAIQATAVTNGFLNEFGIPENTVPAIMRIFSRYEHNFLVPSSMTQALPVIFIKHAKLKRFRISTQPLYVIIPTTSPRFWVVCTDTLFEHA